VEIREDDNNRFVRLGKVDSIPAGKARPALIRSRDRVLKNLIIASVGKLKQADEKFKRIIFADNMTTEDWEDYK